MLELLFMEYQTRIKAPHTTTCFLTFYQYPSIDFLNHLSNLGSERAGIEPESPWTARETHTLQPIKNEQLM